MVSVPTRNQFGWTEREGEGCAGVGTDRTFLSDMDRVSIQSIYEAALYLAEKAAQSRLPRPINPRDLEIYQLHTGEKKTIRESLEWFELSEKRVWRMCTNMRKLAQAGL